MSGALKKSLASWCEAHGFVILCIISPLGEHFVAASADEVKVAADSAEHGFESWTRMSERELREYLAQRGFSASDADDAIQLSREWATTITGSGALAKPAKAN